MAEMAEAYALVQDGDQLAAAIGEAEQRIYANLILERINKVQAMWEQACTHPDLYDTEKVKAYAKQAGVCLGYASGRHHWETDPFTTGDAAAAPGNLCVCGAVRPD